jgi:hypothetical protein
MVNHFEPGGAHGAWTGLSGTGDGSRGRHRGFGPRTAWQVEDAGLRAIERKLVLAMPTTAAKA